MSQPFFIGDDRLNGFGDRVHRQYRFDGYSPLRIRRIT
jgi:hypothetical protein